MELVLPVGGDFSFLGWELKRGQRMEIGLVLLLCLQYVFDLHLYFMRLDLLLSGIPVC